MASDIQLPDVPVPHRDFTAYLAKHPELPLSQLVSPYNEFEGKLREVYAQSPDHPAIQDPHVNIVPVFNGHEDTIRIRARDPASDAVEAEKFIMPLKDADRKPDGAHAIVNNLKSFKDNFNLFSESSLVDLDWSNIVVAGSAVVTSLLPVPEPYNESKRALREYYHQKLAPSSDCDIFIYGLDEEAAVEKIKQIEDRIRNTILAETTTIRTRNAITIASEYPTRHVQIVLRLYKSVSEILTGFDVDCSCFAYDGSQVYATPRAITSFMSQTNTIDLSRRSPSFESRLAKYSHRGFETYCPTLQRDLIDPTIFERAFARTVGLARLLVLERLPKESDREAYLNQRRAERGRPTLNLYARRSRKLRDNLKDADPEDVAEWNFEDDVSNYHSFTVPYGPRYNAKKIEKLLYVKDILLNAEWNVKKDRTVNLHRHPCFIGDAENVVEDCCKACPKPTTDEEKEVAEEESKIYVSGNLEFMKDDPGRQAIGSFNPLTADDWTEMAYCGHTEQLCQAIVDGDLEYVQEWVSKDGAKLDRRDHTGRTPLQLAVQSSTVEIVKCLIDAGARIVARVADGFTALHMACARGNAEMVSALLEKSEANEEAQAEKEEKAKAAKAKATQNEDERMADASSEDEDTEMVDADSDSDEDKMSMTQGSFVKVKPNPEDPNSELLPEDESDEPDIYDVNVLAWDAPVSPLHVAILCARIPVIETLVESHGADVLLPVKLFHEYNKSSPRGAILTLSLAAKLMEPDSSQVTKALLGLGATSAQSDTSQMSALHYAVTHRKVEALKAMFAVDGPSAKVAASHISITGSRWSPRVNTPLLSAITTRDEELVKALLDSGAKPKITFEEYAKAFIASFDKGNGVYAYHQPITNDVVKSSYTNDFNQPVIYAVQNYLPMTAKLMLEKGCSSNTLTTEGQKALNDDSYRKHSKGMSLLDVIDKKIEEFKPSSWSSELAEPMELEHDQFYLGDSHPGTYKHWLLTKQLDVAKAVVEDWHKAREEELKKQEKREEKWEKREDEKREIRESFDDLRKEAIARGAKKFEDLYPDKMPEEHPKNHTATTKERKQWEPKPFKVRVTFQMADLTDAKREQYLELFEAVWAGDIEKVRELTLKADGDREPLQICVQDNRGFAPFHLAIARKHHQLAKLILEIAHAQYRPPQMKKQREQFVLSTGDDEYDDYEHYSEDEGEDGIGISSELVNEEFTIDNIADLTNTVGSKISVSTMISWGAPLWMFSEDDLKIAKKEMGGSWSTHINALHVTDKKKTFHETWSSALGHNSGIYDYAIHKNDISLLKFLLRASNAAADAENPDREKSLGDRSSAYLSQALGLGNMKLAEELILSTGGDIPLGHLARSFGVQEKEKGEFYQGLLLRGKHKSEWARDRDRPVDTSGQLHTPPLLNAARRGDIGSVEWYLSDTPARLYREFLETNSSDKSVVALKKSPKGTEGAVEAWLEATRELAVHAAVLSSGLLSKKQEEADKAIKLIKYLADAVPESLDKKSLTGFTPISLAFSLGSVPAAKALIEAGSNQALRDASGKNLVHLALVSKNGVQQYDAEILVQLLDLIDKRLLPGMFSERCSDAPSGLTPIALWINKHPAEGKGSREVLKTMLDRMGTEPLHMMDGSGQFPTHICVRNGSFEILEMIFERYPELAFWENAMGQTPIELAELLYIRNRTADPPSQHSNYNHNPSGGNYGKPSAPSEPNVVRVHELCKRMAKEHSDEKRVLVSVLQASEVAKRLAEQKRNDGNDNNGYYRRRYDRYGNQKTDEVEQWYNNNYWY